MRRSLPGASLLPEFKRKSKTKVTVNFPEISHSSEEILTAAACTVSQTVLLSCRLNDFSDSSQNSRVYASSNGTARVGGRQGNSRTLSDSDSQDKRSRIGFGRSSMQATSSQLTKGSTTSGQDVPPAACQLTNRKPRSTKPDFQSQSLAGSSMPHRGPVPEDAEYANLIGAMDNDLERPESISGEALQEQSAQSIQNKGTHICVYQKKVEALCDH